MNKQLCRLKRWTAGIAQANGRIVGGRVVGKKQLNRLLLRRRRKFDGRIANLKLRKQGADRTSAGIVTAFGKKNRKPFMLGPGGMTAIGMMMAAVGVFRSRRVSRTLAAYVRLRRHWFEASSVATSGAIAADETVQTVTQDCHDAVKRRESQ
jgi:hypothetical protein